MSIVSNQKVGYEGGLAHDRERLAKITRYGACDGDGFVSKPKMPTGLVADEFVSGEQDNSKKAKSNKIVSTAVLLAGGVLIGYLLKEPIGKCCNSVSEKFTKFFSEGKPAECVQKAKDLIFSK